jgi:peptidoglycan hydrolase-like amidase
LSGKKRWVLILFSFCIPIGIAYGIFGSQKKVELSVGYTTKKIIAEDFKTDAETFLIFMMASQELDKMPEEVLKAMAVLDRTWLWYQMKQIDGEVLTPEETDTTVTTYLTKALQVPYLSIGEFKEQYSMGTYYKELKEAVIATSGKVMKQDGEYFIPQYHQISSDDYLEPGAVTIFYLEEDSTKDDLPSACFEVGKWEKGVRITVLGVGNDAGLSLSKAKKFAKEGWDYQKILTHFFGDVV